MHAACASRGYVLAPAKTVRIRDGERLISNGPVVEATEQIAGSSILDCADLHEALEVASRINSPCSVTTRLWIAG
jgi:hypothetical protein